MAIEVQGLEIQIGARTLLHPTNFHVAKGDKIGLVGRNGAGKTTLTRVITGDMLPTAGKVRVSGKLGYLPQDTHASDPDTDRARPHDERARHRHHHQPHPQGRKGYDRPGSGRDEQGHDPVRQGHAGLRQGRRLRGPVRGDFHGRLARPAAGGHGAAARHALRWPAPPHRAGAHPVLRCRHPDPRRADQPLGCRFHRMAARLLEEVRGRLPGHLPLHRTAGRSGEQGLASGRAARPDRHVFAWLEGLPAPARGGRGAPPPRTRSGREEGRPSHEARHSTCTPRPPRPWRRRT